MAKALQRRRGTTAEHANFTGLEGEFTYDTTEKRIVVHDGATAGGIPMAKESEVLKNTGGTMTGAVAFGVANAVKKSTDDSALYIHGSTAEGNGAHLMLCGKGHSTNAGQARLVATDGTNTKTLRLSPDGSAQWDGKEVLTTGNGLPLSGGALTGPLSATSFQVTSDIRLKSAFKKLSSASEKTSTLSAYTYHLDGDESGRRLGVIAQDVQKVLPEAVREGEDGYLSVDYAALTALCVETNKELMVRIANLESKFNTLLLKTK